MEKLLVMLPYKETSGGSKMLAKALGIERVVREADFRSNKYVTVLNWGRGDRPYWENEIVRYINNPRAVMAAIDKISTFKFFKKGMVPHAPWTTTVNEAQKWLDNGCTVFARRETQGANASGLEIVRPGGSLPYAPLYSLYVPAVKEYRVHVLNGECFYANYKSPDAQEAKLGRSDIVRSGSHGWRFMHMDDLPNDEVQGACIAAVEALGLDFGGVDVGVDENGHPIVYEVNTAPEMGPNTTAAYKRAFKKFYGDYKNNENLSLRDI